MQADFWHAKWEKNQIGFHEAETNPNLTENFHHLGLETGARILVPLCGKSLDMVWLMSQGYQVVGVELSELAVLQFFEEQDIPFEKTVDGDFIHYSTEGLELYVGDFFKMNADVLGQVDAVYDRAALVALPEEMRKNYTQHLSKISNTAPQLLATFEYDQSKRNGPPFSVSEEEVRLRYAEKFEINLLEVKELGEMFVDGLLVSEKVWYLKGKG
jgi:thiopurine S-methyltransferase